MVNLSNKDIHFNPNNIKAEIYAGGYRYDLKVLTSAEYMKKVSNRQRRQQQLLTVKVIMHSRLVILVLQISSTLWHSKH